MTAQLALCFCFLLREKPIVNEHHSNIVCNISFQSTENAVLLKITLVLTTALKPFKCMVVPYHVLELPPKKGHPYVSDVIIQGDFNAADCESVCESTCESVESQLATVMTVSSQDRVVMIIECKKTVSASWVMLEPNELIECSFIAITYSTSKTRMQSLAY